MKLFLKFPMRIRVRSSKSIIRVPSFQPTEYNSPSPGITDGICGSTQKPGPVLLLRGPLGRHHALSTPLLTASQERNKLSAYNYQHNSAWHADGKWERWNKVMRRWQFRERSPPQLVLIKILIGNSALEYGVKTNNKINTNVNLGQKSQVPQHTN